MGKASSSKKVARAARAGGNASQRQRKLIFPLAIFAIFVVGTSLVVYARSDRSTASAEAPTVGDHWHAAYGFYICDTFLPPLTDAVPDKLGIHTHGDGVMHVHPFSSAAAGKNAKFSVWGESTGVQFGSDSITMPDGTKYSNGFDCNGQPATLSVYQWSIDDPDADPVIYTEDFGSIRYTAEGLIFTIAVVPEGTDVPKPDSVQRLKDLLAGAPEDPEPTTGATVPGGATATPGAPTASSVAPGAVPSSEMPPSAAPAAP